MPGESTPGVGLPKPVQVTLTVYPTSVVVGLLGNVGLKLCDPVQVLLQIGLTSVTPVLGVTVASQRVALIGWNVKPASPPVLGNVAVRGAKGEAGPKLTGGFVDVGMLLPQPVPTFVAVACKCPAVVPLVTGPVVYEHTPPLPGRVTSITVCAETVAQTHKAASESKRCIKGYPGQ